MPRTFILRDRWFLSITVADPGSGVFLPLDPGSGSGMEKNPDPGSGMNVPVIFFGLKILKFFDANPGICTASGIRYENPGTAALLSIHALRS